MSSKVKQQEQVVKTPEQEIQDAERTEARKAVGKSVALHSIILASILISINFSSKPLVFAANNASNLPDVEIVNATFIDSNVIAQKKREQAQAEAAAKQRQRDQARAEKARAERQRKKREADARKKREQEQQQEEQRLNALEEQRQKEQQRAKEKEAEERRKQQEQALQDELAREMAEQLEQEQAANAAAAQQKVMTEVEKYNALIMQKVRRNLTLDGGFRNKSCTVNIKIASSGLVLSVNILQGDPALCRASQTAVLRAETLPVSSDPAVYEKLKNTNLVIRPDQ